MSTAGQHFNKADWGPISLTAPGTVACKQSTEPSAPLSKTVADKPSTDLLEAAAQKNDLIRKDMTYQEALEWIEANKHLIGTETEKGMYIGALVAVPVDSSARESFLRAYVLNRNSETSIVPFIGDDMEVWAIDTDRITPNGVLLYKRLAD